MRRILFAAGSRANWSSVMPVLKACREAGHEARVVAFGAALSEHYGKAASAWEPDVSVPTLIDDDSGLGMAVCAGLTGTTIAQTIAREAPDFVYIVGDRYEMLPVAYAAVLQNIRVAHQMGGELSGTIDESVRHAITKLSHVHFAATEQSAERLRQMGEGNVHCTGCPRIDLAARVVPERGSYAMLSLHPVTTEDDGFSVASDALNGLLAAWPGTIHLFWPNADAGHAELMGAFKNLMGGRVLTHRNLAPERYMALLAGAAVCVGNSSSAIREGAYFGTPVVDVGSRQRAREVGPNVMRCTPQETFLAVGEQLRHGTYPRSTLYGDGRASERIARVLGGELPAVQKEWKEWRAIA